MAGNLLGGLFGAVLGGDAPKTSAAPVAATEEEGRKAKTARSALYETAGGVTGSELDPEQVKKRNTLFGN